ncbi:MAG: hypothetical protein LBG19_00960 [Prevotellaceae bacterium]|nr:hypothetical protein [Prevotellaceae bacterium]
MLNNKMTSPADCRHGNAPGADPQPVKTGNIKKPDICLADILAYLEHANKRQLRIISNIMEARTLAQGIPSIGFSGIALASVLSFTASANKQERALIAETLKMNTAGEKGGAL